MVGRGRRLRARLPAQAAGPVRRVEPRRPACTSLEPAQFTGTEVSVFLEVEGAAHYLPAYAGNLDIMTSAALRGGRADRRAHSTEAAE